MDNHQDILISGLRNLFNNKVAIYAIDELPHTSNNIAASLLHHQITKPLEKDDLLHFIREIANYLQLQDENLLYAYFYPEKGNLAGQYNWVQNFAFLHNNNNNHPKEIVIFSFNIQLMGEIKKKVHFLLNNYEFYKAQFNNVASLSNREKEILKLVSSGMNSSQIATELFISIHTVNTHRKSINRKLKFNNISNLISYAEMLDLHSIEKNKNHT